MNRHDLLDDDLRALAALHALGALEGEESVRYRRHLSDGCPACQAEVEAMTATGRNLVWAAPPVPAPRPTLRDRLLAEARVARPEAVGYEFVSAAEGEWYQVSPGVERKNLAGAPTDRSPAYLIRVAPGAVLRTHEHRAIEHCMVLSGDFNIAGRTLHAGDYHRASAGSTHAVLRSSGGCVFLVVEAR